MVVDSSRRDRAATTGGLVASLRSAPLPKRGSQQRVAVMMLPRRPGRSWIVIPFPFFSFLMARLLAQALEENPNLLQQILTSDEDRAKM